MAGPLDILKERQALLTSQIETGRREAQSYMDTGSDMYDRVNGLKGELDELDAFIAEIEGEQAARVASVAEAVDKG